MHELSLCQALIAQAEQVAREHDARAVKRILVRIGPLSGAEAPLLKQAFPLAAAGSLADGAELVIDLAPIRVRCLKCDAESEATANRLICGHCGDYHTRLVSGDEMLLESLELDIENTANASQ